MPARPEIAPRIRVPRVRALPLLVLASGVLAALELAAPARADEPTRLEEGYGDAFVNYRPYVSPGQKPQPEPLPAAVGPTPPLPAAPKKDPGKQPVDVAWLRKNYPVLEERAINDPTEANVSSYLYVKRIVMDKSQRFAEAVSKVTLEDPLLNENNRIPYASMGSRAVKNANYLAEQDAVRELAKIGGLLIFVDGNCRFCAMQLPIADKVHASFGLEYLVVTMDGAVPKDYRGSFLKDNGLFKKLGLKLTPSMVFVPRPKGYQGGADPNQYLVVAQGFYAADEMVKQIAFAGHATTLLSHTTMAGLEVWDRGVTSQEDLGSLTLDVDKPAEIKDAIQPLLSKQYR